MSEPKPLCTDPTCDLPEFSGGLCSKHYHRRRRAAIYAKRPPIVLSPNYTAAHRNVYRLRGKAADQTCIDCGGPATDWSLNLDHPSPKFVDARIHNGPLVYSMDAEAYDPRCRRCHLRRDRTVVPPFRTAREPAPESTRASRSAARQARRVRAKQRTEPPDDYPTPPVHQLSAAVRDRPANRTSKPHKPVFAGQAP